MNTFCKSNVLGPTTTVVVAASMISMSLVSAFGQSTDRSVLQRPKRQSGRTINIGSRQVTIRNNGIRDDARRARNIKEDIAHWRKVILDSVSNVEKQKAYFHLGILYVRSLKFDLARVQFEVVVKKFPTSKWTNEAQVQLVIIYLESSCDLTAVHSTITPLTKWANEKSRPLFSKLRMRKRGKKNSPKSSRKKPPESSQANRPKRQKKNAPKSSTPRAKSSNASSVKLPHFVYHEITERRTIAAVFRVAALHAAIHGRLGTAKQYFLKSRVLDPAFVKKGGEHSRLYQQAFVSSVTRRGLTPLSLWQSQNASFPYVSYSDALLHSSNFRRAHQYVSRLLQKKNRELSKPQRAYLHFVRAKSLNGFEEQAMRKKSIADFEAAYRLAPQAKWAAECLFLAGNASWNHLRNADQAIGYWRKLLKQYPKSRESERSTYYVGVVQQMTKQYKDAKATLTSLLSKNPKTMFAAVAKKRLKEVDRQISKARP